MPVVRGVTNAHSTRAKNYVDCRRDYGRNRLRADRTYNLVIVLPFLLAAGFLSYLPAHRHMVGHWIAALAPSR